MSRLLAVVGLLSASLMSNGCMSLANHAPYFCPDETKRERVYGGVRLDVERGAGMLVWAARGDASGPTEALQAVAGGGLLLFVDLPLCAVADTLLLPHTLRPRLNRPLEPVPKRAEPPNPVLQPSAAP
jgi:uncharacterized protein YceK